MSNFIDMAGQQCERLYVMWRWYENGKNKKALWFCLCDCGNFLVVDGTSLRTKNTQSCGCLSRDKASARMKIEAFKHGHSGGHKQTNLATGTYRSWTSMRSRCHNPNTTQYENYGGRGIVISPRWDSFETFLADMGVRPKGTTLDRWPNKNGNYEPGNCRWSSPQEQMSNRRHYQALDKFTDDEILAEVRRRGLERESMEFATLSESR